MSNAIPTAQRRQLIARYAQAMNIHALLISADGTESQIEAAIGNVFSYDESLIPALAVDKHLCLPATSIEDVETILADIKAAYLHRNPEIDIRVSVFAPDGTATTSSIFTQNILGSENRLAA